MTDPHLDDDLVDEDDDYPTGCCIDDVISIVAWCLIAFTLAYLYWQMFVR